MASGEAVDRRVCSSTAAMRRPSVLGLLRLSIALLLTYLTYATTQTEKHLVCRKPNSKTCLVWSTVEHYRNQQNSIPTTTIISVYCGFSNILPKHSGSKYIQIKKSEKISTTRMYCEKFVKVGQFIEWTKVANELERVMRVRRQSFIPRGRYRGQTQSQYLAIDRGNGKDEGKAEAHSAADSSRASVSGNSGMGQAQSQSIYDPSCDDCNGKTNQEIENLKRPSGLKPENQYGPSVDSTWQEHVGPSNLPDKSYTQTSPDHYGSSYRPTPGQLKPGTNGNEIYGPQGTGANRPGGVGLGTAGSGPVGPGAIGDSNYRPSTTNGGYGSTNYPGVSSYPPTGAQGGNGFSPISGKYDPVDTTSNKDFGHNGIPVGFEPGTNGQSQGYTPNNIPMENFKPGTNSGPGSYGNQNTGLGNTNNGKRDPTNIVGTQFNNYRPPESGNNNYIPGYNVNKYNEQPGKIVPGFGNDFRPQNGVANFGNGEPNSNINRDSGGGISNPSTSQSNSGYLPGSHISKDSSRPYGPESGFNQREAGLPHWPIASGPYPGPAGSNVYCCVVPNNAPNGNLYPNNIYSSDKIPTTSGQTSNIPYVSSGGANNVMAPSGQYGANGYGPGNRGASYGPIGQYGPGSTGTQYGPGNMGTQFGPNSNVETNVPQASGGTGSFPMTGGHYGAGVSPYGTSNVGGASVPGGQYQSPDVQYRPSNTGGSLTPSGKYVPTGYSPGSSSGPIGQYGQGAIGSPVETGLRYGPGSPGTSVVPGGQYVSNSIAGPAGTGLQYGPGSSGSPVIPGVNYGTGGNGQPGLVTGLQYAPGSTTVPGGQYETGGSRGPTGVGSQFGPSSTGPGGQYGPTFTSGTPSTGIQNTPGSSGSSVEPGRQYEPTSSGGSPGTGIQYGSGIRNPPISGDQYGPGSAGRPISNTGQYGSASSGGPAGPGGQYGQGSPVSSVGPGGQYTGGAGYLPGSTGVQYTPGGAGGLYTPSAPGGQYTPNVGQGPIESAGRYGPGNSNTPTGPNGQYGPGNTVGPGGQYGSGTAGQYVPSGTGGQYSPGGLGGQYSPGSVSGSYAPGVAGNTGQYIPGSSGVSAAPDGRYGPGSGIGNGGQYGSGPSSQYAPGRPDSLSGGSDGPGSVGGQTGNSGQYGPGNSGVPSGQNTKYNSVPQNYVDPNSVIADGDDSEAEASIAQNINGTTASASSKGGNDKGRAQTNVQGTYTGSGSFQAQAQIIGENKEAQSEVNGGKKGASSSATGSGRNNKSQANVQLGSETGSIQTQSQSNGVMHSSNSQVQGSVKGGMADAQARGPGSTSSQAQIGFTPYKDEEKNIHDLQKLPFIGGGMASAQSSGRTGQSQSQLHGTFKYGISYNGAAQSGASLDKDAIFPNRLSFEKIDVFDEKNKNINVDKISIDDATELYQPLITEPPPSIISTSILPNINNTDDAQAPTTKNSLDESMKNSESRYSGHSHLDHHVSENSNKTDLNGSQLLGSRRSFQTNFPSIPDYEFTTDRDDTQPEYDTDVGFDGDANEASDVEQAEYSNYDEYTTDSPPHQYLQSPSRKGIEVQQTTGGNSQHIVLGSLKNHNAEIIQKDTERPDESKVYQPGERVPGTGGYTIPVGFTGSVKSVASKDKTYVVGSKDSPSQAQTVTLTPGTGKVKYVHPSSYGKYVKPKNLRSLQSPKENENKYVSVSKSVTRDLDSDNNIRKQYSHTYYTKSSSCGYFTFTCTMVSSAEGRKKVCKPKMPTNPDGTPIRC